MLLAAALGWLFAAGGLEGLAGRFRAESRSGQVAVGQRPPGFALIAADGQAVSLEALSGRAVVINFWATWCLPCRAEMPELEAVYRAQRDQGLSVLAINLGDEKQDVDAFGRELGLTFPLLLDPLSRVTAEYGVRGLPTTVFVGRDGRVTSIHNGALSARTLREQVERILS